MLRDTEKISPEKEKLYYQTKTQLSKLNIPFTEIV